MAKIPEANIKLEEAKLLINRECCVLKREILKVLKKNNIVRISMHVSKKSKLFSKSFRDSPYVKILDIKDNLILGEILDIYRFMASNYYPLKTGERIWFEHKNIIEIYDIDTKKYKTDEYIRYSGPLETVDYESSSSESGSESDDSDSEESIDLTKLNSRVIMEYVNRD